MKKALIIQGGGFRTAFSAGVLDAFMEVEYNPFNIYAGISAGSIAMSYYIANQPGYCFDAMKFLSDNNRLINLSNFWKAKPVMNVDIFKDISAFHQPFKIDVAMEEISNKKVAIVMTDKITGQAHYHHPCEKTWQDAVIASCSIPFATAGSKLVNGVPYMDGDWSDPLPVQWAVNQGATDVTVIQTMPFEERKAFGFPDRFGALYHRRNSGLQNSFKTNHHRYNESLDFIQNNKDVNFQIISPKTRLKANVYTNDSIIITNDYNYGKQLGLNHLNAHNV